MTTYVSETNTVATLTQALLVWSHKNGEPAYASMHDVRNGVVQPTQKPLSIKQLNAFCTVTVRPLKERTQSQRAVEVIPSNVLFSDPENDITCWWRPSQASPQFFDCAEFGGAMQGVCNLPSLVFFQKGASLHICAVTGSERPTSDTAVFHAPMFNTDHTGYVCLGNIGLVPIRQWSDMPRNEREFLHGINTHPNGKHIKTRYPSGLFSLWRDLVKNPETPWDDAWLNPMNLDLQTWIKGGLK